tara:strand:+ start:52 stop:1485 length:1434 start_codon:yes stop_codon:yes gene_type:complete
MVFPIAGGTQATGDFITNSVRFNDDDGARLTLDPGTSTNNKKCTLSFWAKIGVPTSNGTDYIFSNHADGNNRVRVHISNTGEFAIFGKSSGSTFIDLYTNAQYRDSSAWYHFLVRVDSTDGTANNRLKLYVNGTLQTDVTQGTNPDQNADVILGSQDNMTIGAGHSGSAANSNPYDGYLAEMHFLDGTAYDASYFGETNDNGVWIPKKYTGGNYGTNGFYMEFKQTGTSQNSSGIGADTSGQDNHFAVTNLAATDITTDTPQNNFATINPLASIATLSEGNCKVVTTNGERMAGASTIGFENGKWYMEYKVTDINSTNMTIGIDNEEGLSFSDFRDNDDFWNASNTYAYENNGNKRSTGVNASYGNSYTTGDIIGVAVDMDNRKIYFSKNGTYQNSGDPTTGSTGTGSAFDLTDGLTYFFQAADNSSAAGVTLEANFGQPSFSISSGNADANGHGNFEYAPPSGYFALCTKNLAEFG